jgi:hypothetical protein
MSVDELVEEFAIVVLGKGRWSVVKPHVEQVVAAVNPATPGTLACRIRSRRSATFSRRWRPTIVS